MNAALQIARLRAQASAGDAVRARLAAEALVGHIDPVLPGLPPQSLLLLRALTLGVPAGAFAHWSDARQRLAFATRAQGLIASAAAGAVRPAHQGRLEDAEAVLFADEAELLACLARDAATGQLHRWWWRLWLGHAHPRWAVAFERAPAAVPAAIRQLQAWGLADWMAGQAKGAAARMRADPSGLSVRDSLTWTADAQPRPGAAPTVAAARAGTAGAERRTPPAIELKQVTRRRGRAALAAPKPQRALDGAARWPLVARHRPSVQARAGRDRTGTRFTARPHQSTLRRAGPVPIAPHRARLAAVRAAPQLHRRHRVSPRRREPDWRSEPRRFDRATSEALRAATPPRPQAAEPRQGRGVPPAESARSRQPRRRVTPLASPPTRWTRNAKPRTDAQPLVAQAAALAPSPVDPVLPVRTAFGGVFFLVNTFLARGWLADFTQPAAAGRLQLPPWRLLADVALVLAGPALRRDPLWAVLRELDAAPSTPARRRRSWLRTAHRTAPAERSSRVAQRLARSLREPLAAALHLPMREALSLLLRQPATLWVTAAEVTVVFSLQRHPTAVRQAGLDRDPGWLPAAERRLRFVFEDGA